MLGRTWSKHKSFGRAGRNVSRGVELGRNIDVFGRAGRNLPRLVEPSRNIEVCGRADRNISRLVELGRNLEVLVAPVETYLAWSNLFGTKMFWSRRSKRISLGGTWSKPRCFDRADQNASRLVELGRNIDFLVAPVETYLAWSNLVRT